MATKSRGFFADAFQAFVNSRERQADRHVSRALLMLDDETLKANGYSRPELTKRADAYRL